VSEESDIQDRVAKTRADLESTLDAIEDKLNVPKRVKALGKDAKASFDENKTPWIVGAAAGVAAIGGLIAWAVASRDD
jgi:hypothetical protein